MLGRIRKSISAIQYNIRRYGCGLTIRTTILSKAGAREICLRAPNLSNAFWCRLLSSDIYEYSYLLGRNAPVIRLPIVPEYIVDAGSNAGYSVLRFHSEFPNAEIVAIEPEVANLAQLRKNVLPYPVISIEAAALWPRSTKLRITIPEIDHNAFQVEECADGVIEAMTVREVMKRHNFPRIDLLKIDIEGSEKELFESHDASEWIKDVRMILIETHDRFKDGCTDAVDAATKGKFIFGGMVGEYRLYVSRSIDPLDEALD